MLTSLKGGGEDDVHEPKFSTATYLIRYIEKKDIVGDSVLKNFDTAILLHYEDSTATVSGMGNLHRQLEAVEEFLKF